MFVGGFIGFFLDNTIPGRFRFVYIISLYALNIHVFSMHREKVIMD